MKLIFALLVVLVGSNQLYSQAKYFVSFTDKKDSKHSIEEPLAYLSEKAIDRRNRQGISVSESDLPVSTVYIKRVMQRGAKVLVTSKWHNGVVIEGITPRQLKKISKEPYVKDIKLVFDPSVKGTQTPDFTTYTAYRSINDTANRYDYGAAVKQISMHNGHILHNFGYIGKGITIAVLDGGFYKADILPVFDSLWINKQIILEYDVVEKTSNIYEENSHGMFVLSVMGANYDGQMVGTAPGANYALIRCEDTESEQVIEEYYWTAAAELADSIGADILNSSLGYYNYDASWQALTYSQIDGKTTPIALAAGMAAQKGMLVVVSAGNEATTDWKYIITPADAHGCIAVGAVKETGKLAAFSSIGPTADGRIKPDVVAVGENTVVQATSGEIGTSDGTSLSAPIISGLAACLWQAMPDLSSKEIAELIIISSNQYHSPDNLKGYGIPDFLKALEISKKKGLVK
jgi:subtilisin family serine protease